MGATAVRRGEEEGEKEGQSRTGRRRTSWRWRGRYVGRDAEGGDESRGSKWKSGQQADTGATDDDWPRRARGWADDSLSWRHSATDGLCKFAGLARGSTEQACPCLSPLAQAHAHRPLSHAQNNRASHYFLTLYSTCQYRNLGI